MRRFSHPAGVYNTTPARVVFGPGSSRHLAAELELLGISRALVVTTPGRAALGRWALGLAGERGVGLMAEAVSQVPIELAWSGRARARAMGVDGLVCIGGGSATGLAKGIALELAVPFVAIPTTYSGSEMTGFCGITTDGVKRMEESLNMLAATVIYDADLTLTVPVVGTAASAMNALAHCIDAVYLPTVSPLIAPACVEGAQVIVESLPRVLRDQGDREARNELLYGAYLAGAALSGGFALQHGIAHTLGGSFGIEHGLSHAIVLPHVAAHLERLVGCELAPIRRVLGGDGVGPAVFDLLRASSLPTGLAEVGMTEDDLPKAVEIILATAEDNSESPVPVTEEVVTQILDSAYRGERPQ